MWTNSSKDTKLILKNKKIKTKPQCSDTHLDDKKTDHHKNENNVYSWETK